MTTLSDAYTDNPLHLHHIIPLDFDSNRTVPESHVWHQSDDVSVGIPPHEKLYIPIVDLTDPDAVKLAGHACETWGIFQITNHGIPRHLLEAVEREGRRLFALPARQKVKALRAPGGTTGYGVARISKFFSKNMWHEGFTIIGSPVEHARELFPGDCKGFCDVMQNYQKEMKDLAERLTRLLFKSLDISEEEISWLDPTTNSGGSSAAIQLNSYPSCPDPNRVMGLAPHTDTFLLTILHQSNTNGLQIFKDGAGWVSVVPVEGALVVNVGDMFHILSNALFPSVLHRAVVNGEHHRLSVAYFYGPPTDFNVSPLSKILDSGEVACYRSVTVKEYISMKAKNLEKALSFIRINN